MCYDNFYISVFLYPSLLLVFPPSSTSMLSSCVKIGEGVYGEVYRTEYQQRPVAVKVR